MNIRMELDEQLEEWLADNVSPESLATRLPDAIVGEVVDRLKHEADRHWSISPSRSYELASRIVAIGQARTDDRQVALGLMAQGDALKFLGRYEEAWKVLDQSGRIYKDAGDDVGWARTRIGRLFLGLNLNRVAETLGDVDLARVIFRRYGEQEKLIRLEINTAYVYTQLGDQHQALRLYHSALEEAEALGDAGEQYIGLLHMNIGYAYGALGNLSKALADYEKARNLFLARNETRNIVNIDLNIAYIAQTQGQYRRALKILYDILERGTERFPLEEMTVKQDLTECYLVLNRYSEARELARQVIDEYESSHDPYDIALSLIHLATAEAELGNYNTALETLNKAITIFTSLGARTWSMIARLRQGQIALKQSKLDEAYQNALTAADHFRNEGQQGNFATACTVIGQVMFKKGELEFASTYAADALQIARRHNVPSLRYAAHLLLGRIADAKGLSSRAVRNYRAAAATIERVQRRLTITLRSGFLEDKDEAGQELVRLFLRIGQVKHAFEALEQAKAQVLLSYLNDREQFHWLHDEPESNMLLKELEELRAEHHWFYRLAHEPPKDPQVPNPIDPDKALKEVVKREKRMRAITEKLYLHSSHNRGASNSSLKSLEEIQEALSEDTLLIEYYNDGEHLWAFTLDDKTIEVNRLQIHPTELEQLIRQLQVNIATAFKFDSRTSPASNLTRLGQRILQRLYSLLLEPLDLQQRKQKRLAIVPYGALHYLPFNLLYDGSEYLIERFELVILPAASLATPPGPERTPGALVLSHSQQGRLPEIQAEAQLVHHLMGGTIWMEESATRKTLQTPPSQVLHIAAHGQHRLDHPDLSYVELADGQLYTDDLLQQNLSYELVTLSGCETGRAHVSGGDELIGLGRGLLYAGAGALILSLWQVADSSTVRLMEKLYRTLRSGSSKAAALREAQLSFLTQDQELHPAFWGAFQLVGDPGPLSKIH